MVAADVGADAGDLGARLLDRRVRSESRKHFGHAMRAALFHGRTQMVRARHHVDEDVGARRVVRRLLDDADDRRRHVVDAHAAADDARVAAEVLHPERVGQYGDRRRGRPVVLCAR